VPTPDDYPSRGADEAQDGVGESLGFGHLWTPHRMAYIDQGATGERAASGCPFDRIPTLSDTDGLVVARGETCYVVLNLYPYNPGHLMVVPFRHVADYADLAGDERSELGALTVTALQVIRAVSAPQGFNVGMNLGSVAGGGDRRAPAPARRAALGRRHELHAGGRAHQGAAPAARRHEAAARRRVAALIRRAFRPVGSRPVKDAA